MKLKYLAAHYLCSLLILAPVPAASDWMLGPWEWCEYNPVLGPRGPSWEAQKVFDPAAIVKDGKLHMIYRGEAFKAKDQKLALSSLGLATSDDGLNFDRRDQPILTASEPYELPGGCFFPRVVQFSGGYYMTYAGFDGQKYRPALATSNNLLQWQKRGLVFTDRESKGGAIVPQKVNGKYVMYFGTDRIWIAYSDDLLHWRAENKPVLEPRPSLKNAFDALSIEPGPNPIVTSKGILLLCNGLDSTRTYSLGQVLFDKSDPARVLQRTNQTFLEEPTNRSCASTVKINVRNYGQGLVYFKSAWNLYYSYEDVYISLATCKQPEKF